MATYTYGHSTNDYVEVADPTAAGQTVRPVSGTAVLVRDAETLADLPGTVTELYGYLNFTTTAPVIRVSADAWVTYRTLYGEEALRGAIRAGVDAAQAASDSATELSKVNTLDTRVQTLEAGGTTGTTGGTTFSGSVDWNTQIVNKPTFNAAFVGALATTQRGAPEGVAPLSAGLVPIANLPVGTSATQVAQGSHTHAQAWSGAPAGTVCVITETSAGVYPTPPTARADIVRWWRGSVRPTAGQGLQAGDEWRNTAS